MCSEPIFCSKVAKKGKICSRLLELQKIAPNAKSCSKVAEQNRERPTYDVKLVNSTSYGERGYVTEGFCLFFFFQLRRSSWKFNSRKIRQQLKNWGDEMRAWSLKQREFTFVSGIFVTKRPGLESGWRSSHFLEACSRLQDSQAEQNREKLRENCVGAWERPSSGVVLSSFSLLSSRRFSIVCFITARSPFFRSRVPTKSLSHANLSAETLAITHQKFPNCPKNIWPS